MQVIPIPCLSDNYAYVIIDKSSNLVGVIDPSEALPIINFLKKKKLKLNYILNTHHHFDHVGGNLDLKEIYKAKIVGFVSDKHRIPGIDILLNNNQIWKADNFEAKIMHIPGHTTGHICYHFFKEKLIFTGDTLFSLGCGKLFSSFFLISVILFLSFVFSGSYSIQNLEF